MAVKLTTNFAKTAASWRNRISLELNAANKSQVSVAEQLSPVDSGDMKRSVHETEEATPDKLRAASQVEVEYGVYVEFGFVHYATGEDMEPQPFWTPAFKLARMQLLNSFRSLGGRSNVTISYGVNTLSNPDTFVSR